MAAGGGAWKVAYADFVTAMMAFFMVMWLTSQNDGVKEAVAGYFREPFATYKSHQKGAAGTAKPVVDPMYGHTAQPQKRRLAISGDVTDYQFTLLFGDGLATLEPEQLEKIREIVPMMSGKLNRIEVRAHSIRSPLPSDSPFHDHWDLCFARCQNVREALQQLGIEPERIRLSQAEGNEPLSINLTPDELRLNSRVDVILLPDLADIPWERRRSEEEPVSLPALPSATSDASGDSMESPAATVHYAASPALHDEQVTHDPVVEDDAHADENHHGESASLPAAADHVPSNDDLRHGASESHAHASDGHAEHAPAETYEPHPH